MDPYNHKIEGLHNAHVLDTQYLVKIQSIKIFHIKIRLNNDF